MVTWRARLSRKHSEVIRVALRGADGGTSEGNQRHSVALTFPERSGAKMRSRG